MLSETDQVSRYATPLLIFARSALLENILSLTSSLVRDGQTNPHKPRPVVSHRTCPPLSSSPVANSLIGTVVRRKGSNRFRESVYWAIR
jgi:hypothetical protein